MIDKINDMAKLLKLASKDDIVSFLLKYAKKNRQFGDELRDYLACKFMDNKNVENDYVIEMRHIFSKTTDIGNHWNCYEVADWEAILESVMKLINKGRILLNIGNADAAAKIVVEFFKQMGENFDDDSFFSYDDENDCSYECEQAEKLLLDALTASHINSSLKQKMLGELKEMSISSGCAELVNYGMFDFDEMLFKVNMLTASVDECLNLIDEQIVQHEASYDLHKYVARKIQVLRNNERSNEADNVEHQFIYLPEIRQSLVEKMIESGAYDKAAEVLRNGLTEAQIQEKPLLVGKWLERLFDVYEKLGDKEKQIQTARRLFINSHGDIEYYHKLRKLIQENEWKDFLRKMIDETRFNNYELWGTNNNLADIYVEEGEREKLFQYIMKHSSDSTYALDTYARYVSDEHADGMLRAYDKLLRVKANGPADVKKYPHIAASMKCMEHLKGGKEAAHRLAEYFRCQYPRRSSFMAEISEF